MANYVSEEKIKDLILGYCIDAKRPVSIDEINEKLFPSYSIKQLQYLVNKISVHYSYVADIHIGHSIIIEVNEVTERFLEKGGFSQIEEDLIEEAKTKEKKARYDLVLSKFKVITRWPIFILAIIGGCLSIYNFFNGLAPSSEIENIQKEMIELRSKLENIQTESAIIDSIQK